MARVYDSFDAVTHAVRSAGPAGIDQPYVHIVLAHLLTQHLCIFGRMQWQEGAPKQVEGQLRFGHTCFSTCYLGVYPLRNWYMA